MANPALKNGYFSIALELAEALARKNIPGNEMRMIWVLWRRTWGWENKQDTERRKDWDWISYGQFEKATQMGRRSVGKCLKSLVAKRLLLTKGNQYKFNQNYDEWLVAKRLPPVANKTTGSSQKTTKNSSQMATHKRNTTNTTKEITTAEAVEEKPFDYQEEWNLLKNSTRKDHKIIALYWKYKDWKFENKKQISNAIRRDVRSANYLVAYNGEDVLRSMTHCQKNYEEWTLETVLSKMDDIKNKTIKPKK